MREKYGGTSVTRLRQLTSKFDTYKKLPNHNITQHVRIMSTVIRELKLVGHILSNEQQVQASIRSLFYNWEHLKVNLTHNDSIKTFADAACHVELEDERLGAAKFLVQAFVAESSSGKASGFKRKKNWFKGGKGKGKETRQGPKKNKHKRNNKGKWFGKKKDKSKLKYFNYQVLGHFAQECPELKKVALINTSFNVVYASSTVMLTILCRL